MADTSGARRGARQSRTAELSWDEAAGETPVRPSRDWKRVMLVIGLGTLSWVATYVGMLELIEANMGDLPLMHKAIIGFSVAMLMVMVVWLLDQIFADISWLTRLLFIGGYVFLTAISVGFGFGFYWKVLESRGESSRSAESAVGQVQNALHGAATRLEQLQGTLDSLTAVSAEKAALERANGTSCPNSRPGDGPRRQMRDDDAGRFKFAADFVRGRVGAIKGDLGALTGDMTKVMGNDKTTIDAGSGTRNEFMRGLNRRLDMTVTGFNAFRGDPQLRQIRADLAERADKVSFADSRGGTYLCPDAQLSTALKGVVRAIDELPTIEKPKIAAVEGSEAVIEAFRRLTSTLVGALSFKLPPSPEELRDLQKKAVQSVDGSAQTQARLNAMAEQAGLSKRDYIPLAIALFVDLCLLLVSIQKGGSPLERLVPKMRAAERGPVIQILSRFNDIHRDPEIRENFEVFRHVVFDFHGDYYAAVPLNTPYRPNPRNGQQRQGYGVSDAEELLQQAHLLANLFASFEKEKIFTRVYSPLLSTGTVQKRLRRQGSKFANAEAFRVYRFRDGAWSEIILGAVMGAARRVEAGERRRRIEDDLFGGTEPMPTLAPGHGRRDEDGSRRSGVRSRQQGETVHGGLDEAFREPTGGRGMAPMTRPPFMPQVVPAANGGAAAETVAPGRPANNNTWPLERVGHEARRDTSPVTSPLDEGAGGASAMPENVVMHPAVSGGRGTGERDPGGHPAPRSAATDAGASTEPAQPRLESVTATVTPPPAEPSVTVAATRETVTYTLPVSEARLPPSLLMRSPFGAQASAALSALPGDVATAEVEIVPAKIVPPPLKPVQAVAVAEAVREPTQVTADGGETASQERSPAAIEAAPTAHSTDDVRTMALRFGPSSREG